MGVLLTIVNASIERKVFGIQNSNLGLTAPMSIYSLWRNEHIITVHIMHDLLDHLGLPAKACGDGVFPRFQDRSWSLNALA